MAMEMLTIGIPTYNRTPAMCSLLNTLSNYCLNDAKIVVSDNSDVINDSDQEMILAELQRNKNVRYIKQDRNIGAWNNFKYLAENCDTEYFMWHQDDDFIKPDFMYEGVNILSSNDSVLMHVCYMHNSNLPIGYFNDVCGPQIPIDFVNRMIAKFRSYGAAAMSMYSCFAIPPGMIFRTEVLKRSLCGILENNDAFNERTLTAHICATNGPEKYVTVSPHVHGWFIRHQHQMSNNVLDEDRCAQFEKTIKYVSGLLSRIDTELWTSPLSDSLSCVGHNTRQAIKSLILDYESTPEADKVIDLINSYTREVAV